jgi:hypothetical protein
MGPWTDSDLASRKEKHLQKKIRIIQKRRKNFTQENTYLRMALRWLEGASLGAAWGQRQALGEQQENASSYGPSQEEVQRKLPPRQKTRRKKNPRKKVPGG